MPGPAALRLREDRHAPGPETIAGIVVDEDDARDARRSLRCAACDHGITDPAAAIDRDGAHQHELANPAGLVFRVRCFARAPGARAHGRPSAEHSWFPPARWSLALCRGCGVQLGWWFSGPEDRFAGLIAERLREDR